MSPSSLIPVKVTNVKLATRSAMNAVLQRRTDLFNEAVARVLRPPQGWRAREEAVRTLTLRQTETSPWVSAGHETKLQARRLESACRLAQGDLLYLSFDDAEFVAQYTRKAGVESPVDA